MAQHPFFGNWWETGADWPKAGTPGTTTPAAVDTGAEAGGIIDFPTDIQPWSGSFTRMPTWSKETVQPQIQKWYPQAMEEAGGLLGSYLSPENYMARLNPYAKAITENMNARGLLGSNVMGEELSEAAMNQYAADQAAALAAYQNFINSMLGGMEMGKESYAMQEDPTKMYQLMASLMSSIYS